MILKTNSIKALLAFEILKNCQNEHEELKSQVLKIVEKNFKLTGNSLQEKFKDLKYGIELYFYYIHKKKDYLWEAIEMSQHNFGQLRLINMEKYKELKNARDSYKTYQSNRINDLIKHYEFHDPLDDQLTKNDLSKKIESYIKVSQKKLLADLEFLNEYQLMAEISKLLIQ